jgi:hypothetical protein
MGEVNIIPKRVPTSVNYRARLVSGSGVLNVRELFISADDKLYAVKLEAPPTLSGVINYYGAQVKPSGWLCLTSNTFGFVGGVNQTTADPSRGYWAANGPIVNFVVETTASFNNPSYNFYTQNFTYDIPYTGNLGMPIELRSFMGMNHESIIATAPNVVNLYTTCLWTQGSNVNAWEFTYPSGIFTAKVQLNATPIYPSVEDLV